MIISHKHKYIFLKTHKTGGTSLQIALSRYCGVDDIISKLHESDNEILDKFGGKDIQNIQVPFAKYNLNDWFQYLLRGRKQYFSEHLDFRNIKRWIGPDTWNSYYKFCFERNPYDKVLSYYYWRTSSQESTIEAFLDNNLARLSDFQIYGKNESIVVDDVFLYENLDESVKILEDKLNLTIDMINIRAKSEYRPKKKSYENELSNNQKKRIAEAFKKEIKLLYPKLIIDR